MNSFDIRRSLEAIEERMHEYPQRIAVLSARREQVLRPAEDRPDYVDELDALERHTLWTPEGYQDYHLRELQHLSRLQSLLRVVRDGHQRSSSVGEAFASAPIWEQSEQDLTDFECVLAEFEDQIRDLELRTSEVLNLGPDEQDDTDDPDTSIPAHQHD